MIYLTGENVFTFNSGTEFSQFERLRAFNENGLTTRLLVRNYNRMLAKDVKEHGLDTTWVINMYDYFQEVVGIKRKKSPLRLLDSMALQDYHIIGIDNNTSELRYQGKLIGKVNVMPETIGLVGDIQYFDSLGYTMTREYFDWRGFKSMIETYHPDGSIATKQFLKEDGTVALEVTNMYINGKVAPTSFKLLDYKGRDYMFDTEDQLYTFFLNEINSREKGDFISDRRTLDRCVLNVVGAKKKLAYIHSSPFADKNDHKLGILPAYSEALGNTGFDQVIFPTEVEANDVKEEVNLDLSVTSAPDSWVRVQEKPKSLTDKKVIVYVGRLAEDKNITDLLKCFKDMYLGDNRLRFKLQGYFSNEEYRQRLYAMVEEFKLQKAVEFIPYQHELAIYQEATLFLNASLAEGFGMNMLESMAFGVPVISYASAYTENNLIKDGINGFNIRNKTPKLLARKALEVLAQKEVYQELSKEALKTAKEHDETAFMLAWEQLLK